MQINGGKNMKRIVMVGGGHRAAFYLRIAQLMPQDFSVTCAFVRDPEKAKQFEQTWGAKAYTDFDQMLDKESADFAILAVFPQYAPEYIRKLAAAKIPVLCETPPALTLDGLNELNDLVKTGAKIQVSEQYHNVPLHAARLNIVRRGIIGPVSHAQVSIAHDYHGLSLMRHLLGIGFENALVTATSVKGKLLDGPTRYNTYVPSGEKLNETAQTLAVFDYGDRSGLFDFLGDQYGSWVRRQRMLVRGDKGEIADEEVHTLLDAHTPVVMPIVRMDTHEYDYMYLHGYTLGGEWVYKNRYLPKLSADAGSTYYGRVWDFGSCGYRMTDDEIAVADMMHGMADYVDGGKEVYSFAEGAQDQYMQLVINEAIQAQKPVMMQTQAWAK
jgi:predicted dehydrogenase